MSDGHGSDPSMLGGHWISRCSTDSPESRCSVGQLETADLAGGRQPTTRRGDAAGQALHRAVRRSSRPFVGRPGAVVFSDLPVYGRAAGHARGRGCPEARGGASPLVETPAAYFDSGRVATAPAARLHLSVRAVTYRPDRVKSLTGFDALDPVHRFTLQVAAIGGKAALLPKHKTPNPTRGGRPTRGPLARREIRPRRAVIRHGGRCTYTLRASRRARAAWTTAAWVRACG